MQHRSMSICTLLTVAVVVWVGPAQSQDLPGDFDGDGIVTPTDYVEELLSLYEGRTAPGLPVVNFSLADLKGNTHTAVEYRNKVLLLWFMGYDCTGCLAGAPELEELVHLRNADKDLQILGLDIWNGSAAQLATFRFTTGVTMPLLQQAANPVYPFGMDVSSIAVVDRDGIVRGIYGEVDYDDVNRMADLILAQAPFAAWSPLSLYYGRTAEVGVSHVITITIKNEGAVDLVVTAIRSSNPDLTLDQTGLTIPPDSRGEVVATFIPSSEGTLSAQVTMVTNDPDRGTVVIPLDAVLIEGGGLPPAIALPAERLDYGVVEVGRSLSRTIEVRNEGPGLLTVTGVESDLAGVSVSEDAFTVEAGESRTITITVQATAEGSFGGLVNILSDDPQNGSLSVSIVGSAQIIPADSRADFDGSGTVDFGDFLGFAAAFGTGDAAFDIDQSGVVDFSDFLTFVENFGRSVQ